jgi:ribose transport system permease protein
MNPSETKPVEAVAGPASVVTRPGGQVKVPALLRIMRVREAFLIVILAAIFVVMSVATPSFASAANLRAVLLGFAMEGIVVIGMTVLLVSGGFDLSVGANMALTGMVTAYLMNSGQSIAVSVLAGLATSAVVGLLNAWVVAKIGVNALIATLGTMTILRGVALTAWQGRPVSSVPEAFRSFGQGQFLGIPLPAVMLIVLAVIFDILMRRGQFFRQLYFVGSSEKAALLSGISVSRVRVFTYVFAGLLAGIAGIVSTSRLSAAYPNSYDAVALRVISGAVIGGCSLFGGEGSIIGSVLGLFFMALILDVVVLFGISPYVQEIVQGVALIGAVMIDIWSKRQTGRR